MRTCLLGKCNKATYAAQQTNVLFDHLVGTRKQRWRNVEAERLCGLEVDNKIESCRLDARQVSGLVSLKNPTGIEAKQAICLNAIMAVAHEPTGIWIVTPLINRRDAVARRQGDDPRAL